MSADARRLIVDFGMSAHPEGGWYAETYRSPDRVVTASGATRSACTSIVFLLTDAHFSAFHRLASDELWHFYRGDPIAIEMLHPDGRYERRDIGRGTALQAAVPAGVAFASHVDTPGGYALVGCDVAPGFEFADFVLPTRAELTAAFPDAAALIARLTRT